MNGLVYHSGHYYHEQSHHLTIDFSWYGKDSKQDLAYRYDDELEEYMKEFIREYAQDIYYRIKNAYEELTSEKAIIEWLEMNEFEFDEYGEVI